MSSGPTHSRHLQTLCHEGKLDGSSGCSGGSGLASGGQERSSGDEVHTVGAEVHGEPQQWQHNRGPEGAPAGADPPQP